MRSKISMKVEHVWSVSVCGEGREEKDLINIGFGFMVKCRKKTDRES